MKEGQVSDFLKLLKFGDISDRKRTVEKFKEIKNPAILPELFNIIYSENALDVKRTAIQCIFLMERKYILKDLIEVALDVTDKEIKLLIIRGLGRLKETTALHALETIVNRSDDEDVIKSASIAMQVIQGITPESSFDE